MNAKNLLIPGLTLCLALLLAACGEAPRPAEPKPGVVYLDPNAAPTARATEAPAGTEAPAAPLQTDPPAEPAPTEASAPEEEPEALPELYFEGKGVRLEPWMEAAPVLAALGEPLGVFEADSCAYIGKDLFYYYPGFELTVNALEGVDRITAVTVADDTVITPQGLRIYDEEEKLLSLLGGAEENGIYAYRSGPTLLLIQVKADGDEARHIASIEYRLADDR